MSTQPTCDLHMHTYYSDGYPSPEAVVRQAARIGLKIIAITDHDNTRGVREAQPVADQLGLELITGIELTCHWDGYMSRGQFYDTDLLGYFVDPGNTGFLTHERAALDDLRDRASECCQRLTDAGYPVTLDDAIAENPRYPGGVQISHALQHLGYIKEWDEARALFYSQWQYVRPARFSIGDNIAAIHAAGGVAILAHPSVVTKNGKQLQQNDIARLVEMGLDGLEVYHYKLTQADQARFRRFAEQFGLVVSGGSDEHAWTGFKRLGTQPITPEIVETLRARSTSKGAV
jgi:predicted metal-dependent phosphoesterase TrpH